jgi:hypothetical protein
MAVASATMTPLSAEAPSNRLLQLVAKVDLFFPFLFIEFNLPYAGYVSAWDAPFAPKNLLYTPIFFLGLFYLF